jgi:predicted metal-dependent HD superfamily phosphohydrolase
VGSVSALADMSIAKGRLNPRDKSLLIVGAAFHDVEQDLGSGAIEEASSATAREAMQSESVFTVEDQDLVDRLIMGTKIHFEDGVMKQTAEREDYLVRLLADADLSSLGRPTDIYWARSVGLFHEFFGESPTKDDQIAFLNNQITPLTHHVYFTEEAVELFPHQADNLSYTEAVFAALNNQTT